MILWKPFRCTACNHRSPGIRIKKPPARKKACAIRGLTITLCVVCGHLMRRTRDGTRDMTADEKRALPSHPSAAMIRKAQERVTARMWG